MKVYKYHIDNKNLNSQSIHPHWEAYHGIHNLLCIQVKDLLLPNKEKYLIFGNRYGIYGGLSEGEIFSKSYIESINKKSKREEVKNNKIVIKNVSHFKMNKIFKNNLYQSLNFDYFKDLGIDLKDLFIKIFRHDCILLPGSIILNSKGESFYLGEYFNLERQVSMEKKNVVLLRN